MYLHLERDSGRFSDWMEKFGATERAITFCFKALKEWDKSFFPTSDKMEKSSLKETPHGDL